MNGLPPNMLDTCTIRQNIFLHHYLSISKNHLDKSISARQGCDPLPRCSYFTPWMFQQYIMNGRS